MQMNHSATCSQPVFTLQPCTYACSVPGADVAIGAVDDVDVNEYINISAAAPPAAAGARMHALAIAATAAADIDRDRPQAPAPASACGRVRRRKAWACSCGRAGACARILVKTRSGYDCRGRGRRGARGYVTSIDIAIIKNAYAHIYN